MACGRRLGKTGENRSRESAMAARREEWDASAAQSTGASREDNGDGSWLQQLAGEALAGLGSGWPHNASASELDGAGKDDCCCRGTSDPPDVDEGFAGTGFYPSEIAAAAAYGLFVGSAWSGFMSSPLPLGPREDISDEELMAARPRDVIKAAHQVRLQAIQSRRVKTCANLKQGTIKAATNGSRKVDAAEAAAACSDGSPGFHEVGASMDREESAGASLEAEMCAVCQINFEKHEHCLACRNCDSGFHVACLNKWLLRADTCPCCRSKVSALTPLSCGNEEDAAC